MSMEGRERSRAHEENANSHGGAVERMEREMSLDRLPQVYFISDVISQQLEWS